METGQKYFFMRYRLRAQTQDDQEQRADFAEINTGTDV